MKSSFEETMTYEEKRKLLYERLDSGYYFKPAKPQVPTVIVPVTTAVAEAAKANPESVRVSATRRDGVTLFARAQRNALGLAARVAMAQELDEDGLPVWQRVRA